MESGLTEFFDFLKEGLAQTGPFVPKPFYDHEGDTLYFYGRDVPSFARRVNPLLSVFLANDDESLVGFKIEGVQRILARMERLGMDKFVIDERHQGIRLTIFLEFALVAPPDDGQPGLERFEAAFRQYDDVVVDTRELQPS
ncbi:MAG TPA: hypothetical protein VNH11_33310 [Pirellulales bacterium]|nr:hypothetical protein [Pirellulales bacterium]